MQTVPPDTSSTGMPGRSLGGGARAVAALALAVAAGIHAAEAMRHLPARGHSAAPLHAAFFTVAALFQAVAAVGLLARPARRTATVVAGANMALAASWALAVTTGLPGSVTSGPEPATLAGGLVASLEVVVASTLLVSARPTEEARLTSTRPSHLRLGAPVAGAVAALVAATSALPISAGPHRHHSTAGPHRPWSQPGSAHLEGVHLHGLGGDRPDPGPDPARQAGEALAGTRVQAGLRPGAVAVGEGVVWVADREAGLVHRLDEATGRALGSPSRVGAHPSGVGVRGGAVWVTNAGSDTVSRLDAATGETVAVIPVGSVPVGVALGAGSVWVTNSAEGTVSRIDAATGHVTTTPRVGYGLTAITFAAGRPWVVASLDRPWCPSTRAPAWW